MNVPAVSSIPTRSYLYLNNVYTCLNQFMRKKTLVCLFFSSLCFSGYSQINKGDIKRITQNFLAAKNDTARMSFAVQLAIGYRFSNIDSSFYYNDIALNLTSKLNMLSAKANALALKGATLLESGKLPEAMQFQFEALKLSEKIKDSFIYAYALNGIGNTYMELSDYVNANAFYFRSMQLCKTLGDTSMYYNEISNIGNIYELMQMPDSALYYQQLVYDAAERIKNRNFFTTPEIMFRMGNAQKAKGNTILALQFYKRGVVEADIDNDVRDLSMNKLFLAKLYKEMHQPDSSMKYAKNSLQNALVISFRKCIFEASTLISELFSSANKFDSAYKYLSIAIAEKDSLTGTKRFQELQRIVLFEKESQRVAESKRIATQNNERQLALIGGLAILLIVAGLLFRNNKQKHKTNKVLQSTLENLSATQAQLIQSEKMASLGELTAGIAHEIQNPLNFVNNFSEVSNELIDEMKQELSTGTKEEAITIANDIKQNLEKIHYHGKRADAIVKGMLQHSRASSGTKEPTDINALADEYLRLSYHGLRTKDKSFNANMITDLDAKIGSVKMLPQDMGRVLLNLFTNAFYSLAEKSRQKQEQYQPTIHVTTRRRGNKLYIHVKDNGLGIPQKVIDKIYQPFFTTKPTGEGTGLGLSMSYDIITKAHGGEMKVESKEGEGAEFIIEIPIAE
jgi:two-component system, NtrC family, sensor kinase